MCRPSATSSSARRRSFSESIYPNNAQGAKTGAGPNLRKNWATDRIIFVPRYAANLAATNMLTRHLESKVALDAIRDEAAKSLNAVCSLLDKRRLTQDVIDQANRAVEAWLNALR
jgi:hypothetical protein